MTYLKKSLAVLLAFVMLFSTMSVAASAFNAATDGGFDLQFKIVMYRKDDSGNWIETTRAKPGEQVKARLFIGTDYGSTDATVLIAWDNQYFKTSYAVGTIFTSGLSSNSAYNLGSGTVVGVDTSLGSVQYSEAQKASNFSSKVSPDILNKNDMLSTNIMMPVYKMFMWDMSQWVVDYEFTVLDNEYVRTSGKEGSVSVPKEFATNPTTGKVMTDVPKGEVGASITEQISMVEYVPNITTTPGTISVFSNYNLDANGGEFADKKTVKANSGVIGDSVSGLFDSANIPTNGGKQFKGWSLTANGEALGETEIAALKYGYSDSTLYAVWSDEVVETTWRYEVYKMALVSKGDGTYAGAYLETPDYKSESFTVNINTPITASTTDYEGFTVDTDKSVLTGVATKGSETVLKVYYKRNAQTVSYLNEDGSAIDTFTAFYGAPVPTLSADKLPSKAGHTLTWDPEIPATVGTSDITIKAKFTPETYLYTFDAVGGEFSDGKHIKSLQFGYGESAYAPADVPTKAGYTFAGWKTLDGKEIPEKVTGAVSLYAQYTPINYTLSFTVDGKSENAPAAITGKHVDDVVTLPALPTVTGYTVSGWNYGDATYAAGKGFKMPAADVTMNAVTTVNKYTVSFDTDGGSYVAPESHAYGEKISSFPTPTRDGYTFTGWTVNKTAIAYPYTMPADEVLLVATWSKDAAAQATLKYEFTGTVPSAVKDLLPEQSNAAVGTVVDLADAPEFTGYEFHGWFYNGRICQSIIMPANGATVTGYWTEKETQPATGTVTFYSDGKIHDTQSGTIGSAVTKPTDPTKAGYKFDYWMDEDGTQVNFPTTIGKTSTTYNAKFTAIDYTVTFTVDGKSENAPAALTGKHIGDEIILPAFPTVTGTSFTGWYYDSNVYAPGNTFEMPAADVTFNAVSSANTYNVYFNTVGGDYIAPETHAYGESISSFPTPVKSGWVFTGWAYGDAGLISYPYVMPANSITLIATWEMLPPDTFTVSYEYVGTVPAGAPKLPTSANYTKGDEVFVAEAPTLEGYTFSGWYYGDADYTDSSFIMPGNSVVLKGRWTPLEYKLTLDANGGKFADSETKKTYSYKTDDAIVAPANPTRDGYTFDGWKDEENTIHQTLPAKMPAKNVTYTAQWKEAEYTVTYYLVKGAETPLATQSYKTNATIVPVTLPEGYLSDGWVDADGNALPEKMGTESLVVYPNNLTTKLYKLTFDANGGYFDGDETLTVKSSEVPYLSEVKAPAAPTREGYNFAGWEPTVSATMPNSNTTYKATWTIIPVEPDVYTATFISDGEVFKLYNVEVGAAIPDPGTPKKFGYKFVGWEPEVPATMPANAVEFVAQWEEDDNFLPIVIGGTVIAGGVIATIAGINTAIITGAAIVGGIIVIGAVAKNTYTVTYIVDGETYKTYKVVAGTKIPVPDDPAKDGFVFDGWDSEIPSKMPKEDLTFTATWKAETDTEIPDTGSVSAGIAAFAVISSAAAAAYVITKKKKED